MGATTKHDLPYPDASDPANVPADMQALADALDPIIAIADQGSLAGRPTSTVGTPGIVGRLYYATDTAQLYWDTGTGWTEIISDGDPRLTDQRTPPDGSVTAVKLGILPQAKIWVGSNQSIPNNALRLVANMNSQAYDLPAGEDQADGSTAELLAARDGLFHWEATIGWASGNTGFRWMFVYKNVGLVGGDPTLPTGGTVIDSHVQSAIGNNRMHLSGDIPLTAGDSLRVAVMHTQGSALSVQSGQWESFLQWHYVSPVS